MGMSGLPLRSHTYQAETNLVKTSTVLNSHIHAGYSYYYIVYITLIWKVCINKFKMYHQPLSFTIPEVGSFLSDYEN